jgi:hypothetical protein
MHSCECAEAICPQRPPPNSSLRASLLLQLDNQYKLEICCAKASLRELFAKQVNTAT